MTALTDDVRALVDAPNLAHIATVLPDGGPHAVPIWIATEGDRLVFLTGPYSRKAHNIEADPRVAFSIADRNNPFSVALVRGRVVERVEGDRAWELIDRISEKYVGGPYPRGQERVAYLVEVERASAQSFG